MALYNIQVVLYSFTTQEQPPEQTLVEFQDSVNYDTSRANFILHEQVFPNGYIIYASLSSHKHTSIQTA